MTLNNNITSQFFFNHNYNDVYDIQCAWDNLKFNLEASISPKVPFYHNLNPELVMHSVYHNKTGISEIEHVSWSQLQLSAH